MSKRPDKSRIAGAPMAKGLSQASWGLSVALAFAGIVAGLWLGGRALDARLGTDPWLQVVGAVAGWVVGVLIVYWAAQRREF